MPHLPCESCRQLPVASDREARGTFQIKMQSHGRAWRVQEARTVQDSRNLECEVGRAGGKLLSIFKGSGLYSSEFPDCTVLRGHVAQAQS